MARPKINPNEKKIRLGITISPELSRKIKMVSNNQSNFIETILLNHFNGS